MGLCTRTSLVCLQRYTPTLLAPEILYQFKSASTFHAVAAPLVLIGWQWSLLTAVLIPFKTSPFLYFCCFWEKLTSAVQACYEQLANFHTQECVWAWVSGFLCKQMVRWKSLSQTLQKMRTMMARGWMIQTASNSALLIGSEICLENPREKKIQVDVEYCSFGKWTIWGVLRQSTGIRAEQPTGF